MSSSTPTREITDAAAGILALTSDDPAVGGWMKAEAQRRQRRSTAARRAAPTFDPGPYSASSLARARRLWTVRATAEHESAFVFAGLLPFALEAKTTLDTQMVIAGMAEDELRHAAICAEVAGALGDDPPAPEAAPAIPRGARPIVEQLLGHVIFGNCMTETVNAARLVDASQAASDPFMKEALLALLADEVRHAKFGFVLLATWRPWLDAHPEALRALNAALPRAFAALETRLSGAGAPREDYGASDVALGSPDPARLADVFYTTVEQAVVPGLEQLGLAASSAWRGRPR